jgi:putative phosphoribosyl transferase
VIIPDATHLFEEPGALDQVARLARDWFERYLLQVA